MLELLKKIWEMLKEFFSSSEKPPPEIEAKEPSPLKLPDPYLRLVDSGTIDKGLKIFHLQLIVSGKVVDKVQAVSGQAGKQFLRQGWQSKAGSMEPLPEGYYKLGPVEWAGGVSNYNASYGDGLGPVWIDVLPKMKTSRSALGIHLDSNAQKSPGTAGCIGIRSVSDLQKVVGWFKAYKLISLTVNFKLGSVETKQNLPPSPEPSKEHAYTYIESPNHNKHRDAEIDTIVVHNTEGSVESAKNRFLNKLAEVSAHYIVGRDGRVLQMVKDQFTAWHSGNRAMNHRSIGIEIEAGAGTGIGLTELQETALVVLIKSLKRDYNISNTRIIPHRDVVATNCPGSVWKTDAELTAWISKNI